MLDVKDLYKESYIGKEITVSGWIKSHRKQAHFGFIDLSDGTCFKNLQVVYDDKLKKFDDITKLKLGSAITVTGKLVESPKEGQDFELVLSSFVLEGDCPDDYPLQAKGRPTREFLRDIAYLRPRTNLFNAVFRVRSVAAYAIHKYFQDNGYVYFHAPLITSSDCEGAGEMFQVTTLDLNKVAETGKVDYDKDFFGKMASLTVSGQLEAETFAMAYKKVYTFGPTFRAENSNTKTHVSEFWMIEPEIAFCDLNMDMDIMEIVDMIEETVNKASTVPLTGKIMLDKEEILDYIQEMRLVYPEELKTAKWVQNERQRILDEAEERADKIRKSAEEEQEKLIDEHEITRKAYEKADAIRDMSEQINDPHALI